MVLEDLGAGSVNCFGLGTPMVMDDLGFGSVNASVGSQQGMEKCTPGEDRKGRFDRRWHPIQLQTMVI